MTYEYFITDHQGNTRVSFEAHTSGTNTVAKLTQENHYYPFGMSMTGMAVRTATPSNPNKHLYNQGSELQDDFGDSPGLYSTPFREYDPVLGRFTAVDPLADNFADWTPYTYAYNNPVLFNDPMGLEGRNPKGDNNMRASKKRFKGYKGSGGGASDSYFYDYSGMGEMEPFEFDDYFGNETTEEEIEDNSHKIAPEGTSVALEGYSGGKESGGDKGKKEPANKPKVNGLGFETNPNEQASEEAQAISDGIGDLFKLSTWTDGIKSQIKWSWLYWTDPHEALNEAFQNLAAQKDFLQNGSRYDLIRFSTTAIAQTLIARGAFKIGYRTLSFQANGGYGIFGQNGLKIGGYKIEAMYQNTKGATIFSLKQMKTEGSLFRLDYGPLHTDGWGLHSTIRFYLGGTKYGSSAQRNWYPSSLKPPFFKPLK